MASVTARVLYNIHYSYGTLQNSDLGHMLNA